MMVQRRRIWRDEEVENGSFSGIGHSCTRSALGPRKEDGGRACDFGWYFAGQYMIECCYVVTDWLESAIQNLGISWGYRRSERKAKIL